MTNTAAPVHWNAEAQPYDYTLDQVLYRIRQADAGEHLLLDSITMADILEDADAVLTFDAMVTPYARLERMMAVVQRAMDQSGTALKTAGTVQISKPYTSLGVAQVAAVFELSDGQTVSVFFHNPDVTPKKMLPTDELISWKFALNKRDVTIVVAPEKGRDLNVREVARRVMRLAEKNSAAFQRANGKKAETFARIEGLKTEIVVLEGELKDAQHDLEVAKVDAEDRATNAARAAEARQQMDAEIADAQAGTRAPWYIAEKRDAGLAQYLAQRPDEAEAHTAALQAAWDAGEAGRKAAQFDPTTAEGYATADPDPAPTQGPLPWDGSAVEDETRWYGTTVRMTARDPKQGAAGGGTMREGDAMLTRVLNRGTVLEVRWGGNDYSSRVTTADRYIVEVLTLVDSKAAEPEPEPEPSPDQIRADALSSAAARTDAAYQFADASDDFKAWVSASIDEPNYSPFASAKAMDQAAQRHGATVQWGLFGGAALDSAYGPEDWEDEDDDEDDEPPVRDVNTGDLFAGVLDASDHWRDQPRERRTGRWRFTRARQAGHAARKAIDHIVSAAKRAVDHVRGLAPKIHGTGDMGDPALAAMGEISGALKVFDSATLDGVDQDGYVGKITKDGEVVGRIDIGDDGKAMVFVGAEGDTRVKAPSGVDAMYSDDDAPMMVDWLLGEREQEQPERTVKSVVEAIYKLCLTDEVLNWTQDRNAKTRKLKLKKYAEFGAQNSVVADGGRQITLGATSAEAIEDGVTLVASQDRNETRIAVDRTSQPEAIYKQVTNWFQGLSDAGSAAFTESLAPSADLEDPAVQADLERFKAGDFSFPGGSRPITQRVKDQDASDDAYFARTVAARASYEKAARAFLEGDLATAAKPKNKIELAQLQGANIKPKPIAKAVREATKPADILKAMMVTAGVNDVRYYLNGVLVRSGHMVSTDGHRMLIVNIDTSAWDDVQENKDGDKIIGRDGKPMDGRYPDYARIMRAEKPTDRVRKVNTAKFAAQIRGIVAAQKMTDAGDKGEAPAVINVGGEQAAFCAKYLLDMAETFQRFGARAFNINLSESARNDSLLARSPDGKVTQIIIPKRFAWDLPAQMAPIVADDVAEDDGAVPAVAPESVPAALATSTDPQREADRALFQSVVDGTADPLTVDLKEMEAAAIRQEADPELQALFEQAVNVVMAAEDKATAGY